VTPRVRAGDADDEKSQGGGDDRDVRPIPINPTLVHNNTSDLKQHKSIKIKGELEK